MRVYGQRETLALAVGLMLAATACSGSAQVPPTPPPTPVAASTTGPATTTPATSPPPAVTPVEAAQVFRTITAAGDLLRIGGDRRLARELVRDGQDQLTVAAYESTDNKPPRYTWGSPTLYVPRLRAGEPLWFTVVVKRDDRTAVLTFVKPGDWQLSSAALLLPGETLPEIAKDAQGYAAAVPADDASVQISPKFMAVLHATVAEAGPDGIAAGLIAPGPFTSEIAAQIAADRKRVKHDGFGYDSIFSAGDYPVFALRTTDGGALIQYSLTRTTKVTTRATKDDYLPVPEEARWAIDPKQLPFRRTLTTAETHQYATAVGPVKSEKAATVVAHDGALTRASGS